MAVISDLQRIQLFCEFPWEIITVEKIYRVGYNLCLEWKTNKIKMYVCYEIIWNYENME